MLTAEGLIQARSRSGHYVAWRGDKPDRWADTAEPSHKQLFAFGGSANDLFPIKTWQRLQSKRWRDLPAGALEDGDPSGWPTLRSAIAEFAASVRGISCTPDQVIIVSSIESASRLIAMALCQPGATAWIEDPAHKAARTIAQSAQLVPVPIPVDRDGIVVEQGLRIAPHASLAVVTPTVQLPTGVRLSDARRRQLSMWAHTQGSWILEADHTAEFPFGRQLPMAADKTADRVVYFDTFGKMLFPSLRLAYLIVPKGVTELFQKVTARSDRPPAMPSQIVLADFLTSGQFAKHLRHCRMAFAERRRALVEELSISCKETLQIEANDRGLLVLARLPQTISDANLAAKAASIGLTIEPLSSYYLNAPAENGLLFAYASFRPEEIRAGVEKLSQLLAATTQPRQVASAS